MRADPKRFKDCRITKGFCLAQKKASKHVENMRHKNKYKITEIVTVIKKGKILT